MSKTWATSGLDLLLEVGTTRPRASLETALRDAVRDGRLAPGTALPSSRALAVDLGLARNTVAAAYTQLVAEGWLTAQQGSATRVAIGAAANVTRETRRDPARRTPVHHYDLTPGTPDLGGFPRAAWLAATRQALSSAPSARLGYPDPRGLLDLRETLASYLARSRGVRTSSEQVVICSGFTQALALIITVLHGRGATTLAMEAFGLGHHREIVTAHGLGTALLDVDADGADIDSLADADGVLLTPSHQFPLGIALSAQRRATALRWARAAGTVIIEDDYDGEFRYDRKPIGAMQGLAPDLVVYVGTASKALVPALGLAWIAVPPRLIDDVVEAKRLADGYTGLFEQLTLDRFITTGNYDRHVRRSRLRYRRRRDHLIKALAERSPTSSVTGIAAGLHAVVRLGPALHTADEAAIVSRAARAGLDLAGLRRYTHEPDPESPAALVVGYGTPPDHSYLGAVDALCDVLS
jgi:GntR family transcriptional regulator/MocR family aminotransferase